MCNCKMCNWLKGLFGKKGECCDKSCNCEEKKAEEVTTPVQEEKKAEETAAPVQEEKKEEEIAA